MMRRTFLTLALLLCGCEKAMRDMYDQPRYKPLTSSVLWADGRASRSLPEGAVAMGAGALAGSSSGRRQLAEPAVDIRPVPLDERGRPLGGLAPEPNIANPLPLTETVLARGRERFDIFCAPCHGPLGDGDGLIVRRGFPNPPSYHSARLRNAPDAHFYGVITHGYGVMYPYANRVPPGDRWAIVRYIRALQRSQHATLNDVPVQERRKLETQR